MDVDLDDGIQDVRHLGVGQLPIFRCCKNLETLHFGVWSVPCKGDAPWPYSFTLNIEMPLLTRLSWTMAALWPPACRPGRHDLSTSELPISVPAPRISFHYIWEGTLLNWLDMTCELTSATTPACAHLSLMPECMASLSRSKSERMKVQVSGSQGG